MRFVKATLAYKKATQPEVYINMDFIVSIQPHEEREDFYAGSALSVQGTDDVTFYVRETINELFDTCNYLSELPSIPDRRVIFDRL